MSVALPADFIQRIHSQMPADAADLLAALDTDPKVSVRIHPRKKSGLSTSLQVPWLAEGFYLEQRPLFTLDPLFHAGSYYPQEASSMFIGHVFKHLDLDDDPVLLDLCAAPGGKSTLLASFLDGRGLLVANEVIRSRAVILAENITKWGYSNVVVSQNDPAHFNKLNGVFDAILVDAPCSGEGMFRKDRVARQEWSLANADLCASRQRRIIADIWPSIKEGGYLVYSTCTFNPAENEENVQWVMQQYDATIVDIPFGSNWGITPLAINEGKGYAFYPHKAGGEGFFCTVIQKQGGERTFSDHSRKRTTAQRIEVPSGILKNQSEFLFLETNEGIVALPRGKAASMAQLISPQLKSLSQGILLGKWMKKEFIPHHSLAMALDAGSKYECVELTLQQALFYLKGDAIQLPDAPLGWLLVSYMGVSLGFVKNIGNRVNNYYPKEWRIRMVIPS
jgi:16S rRNA C967 or C1407 C5-methylase (RsmB/RsmF family)/NOL1/NOP2/fmu family ribosome biogenesis protein